MARHSVSMCWTALVCVLVMPRLGQATGSFVNDVVSRHVDLSTHIAVVTSTVEITARGAQSSEYTVWAEADNVASVTASSHGGKELVVEAGEATAGGRPTFLVHLAGAGLGGGGSTTITVTQHILHSQTPHPAEITQGERQLVVYEGPVYFPSPYSTTRQTTTVLLASAQVESYTREEPTTRERDTIVYGPYESLAAGAESPVLRVHFENGSPFMTASVEREVEVSHWGNVAVEEHYDLAHSGARLKGGFSRLDYQMKLMKGASFQTFTCNVPLRATGLYYRDIIGNISTSMVRQLGDHQELELAARFPLFGGWKTQWYQGYNVPLDAALATTDDGAFVLETTFGPSLQGAAVDELVVKLVLPEGASHITVDAAAMLGGVQETRTKRYTYFDTPFGGRTVVALRTANYVDAAQGTVRVTYRMPAMFMLREPLLIAGAIFLLFASYSAVSRVNLSLK